MAVAPKISPTSNRPATPLVPGRKRIVVAMSGGVDSSVAAALLQAEGHEVIGVTLQLYDHGQASRRRGSCCAGQDIHDARRVADHIGIPHYVLDYEKRFEAAVIQSFADSYLAGETPIPCVTCNAQVKFKDLLDTAGELGADLMATGHYIARRDTPAGPHLVRAADGERDQSYFLFSTTAAQIDRLCFPLGDMSKSDVRTRAAALGLPLADKPDSQDICFVPTGRYTDVIARLRPDADTAGEIVDVDGRVLGRHAGIVNFTIGQRRGLNIQAAEPLFVVRLEPRTRRVVVGPREQLRTVAVALRQVNWLGEAGIAASGRSVDIHAKLRSQQQPQPATLHFRDGGLAIVELAAAEYGVSAGQACVFYEDAAARSRLLGGGWIARAENARRDGAGTVLASDARAAPSTPP